MTCLGTTEWARIVSGEVTVTANGGAPEIYHFGAECTARFKPRDETAVGGYDSFANPPFTVCHSGDRELSIASVLLFDLHNPKREKTTYKPSLNNGNALGAVKFTASPTCSYALAADPLIVEVTDLRGMPAPGRPYVSTDYFRRVVLHLEASGDDASCGPATIVADLVVEQAFDDFVTHQVTCPTC